VFRALKHLDHLDQRSCARWQTRIIGENGKNFPHYLGRRPGAPGNRYTVKVPRSSVMFPMNAKASIGENGCMSGPARTSR
jgi:hypothetical protein